MIRLTVSVSVKGSSAERSSGFSIYLRKCSLREMYALLESESVLAHVDFSRLLNTRNACRGSIVNDAHLREHKDLLPSNILNEAQ